MIRDVRLEDAEKLLDLYAPYVTETAVSFEYDVPSVEEFRERIRKTMEKYPYLVAESQGEILGYCYAGPFHSRKAYERSVEMSIYVRSGSKHMGIGRALYAAMEARLKEMGIRNLYACIAYPETEDEYLTWDSVKFHEKMGYMECGHFHRCGVKFDRWYDIVYMEKIL